MTAVAQRAPITPAGRSRGDDRSRQREAMVRMLMRDALALVVLAAGVTLAVVLWPLSPWCAPGALLVAALLASGVYRARRPAVSLRGPVRLPHREPVPFAERRAAPMRDLHRSAH